MCDSIYGTGNVLAMYCVGPFIKYLVHDMSTIDKNASSVPALDGKEACMTRPAGGTVEIDWQLLSPVTVGTTKLQAGMYFYSSW